MFLIIIYTLLRSHAIGNAYLSLPNGANCTHQSCHPSAVLSVSFDHYRQLLRLAFSTFISVFTYCHWERSIYRNRLLDAFANCTYGNQLVMNTIAILCDIVGNLRPLSTTWACIYLRVYFTNVFYGRRFFDFAKLRTLYWNSRAIFLDTVNKLRPCTADYFGLH